MFGYNVPQRVNSEREQGVLDFAVVTTTATKLSGLKQQRLHSS